MISAAKWGAIIGVVIYIVAQLLAIISDTAFPGALGVNNPGAISLGCLSLLLLIFAFSASGFYTGRETRIAGLGAIAGMVTFVIYGLLSAIYSVNGRPGAPQSGGLGTTVVVDVISVALYLGLAALIGWLGGRPGAGRGRASTASSVATIGADESQPQSPTEVK